LHYIGIDVEYLITHVHAQNDLEKSFIKCLKLIVRSLPMKSKLLTFIWGHIILHATSLVILDQMLTINILICNLFLVYHQIYFIYELLVMRYICL